MAPILQQISGLLAVIVGALTSYLAVAANERRRWKHQRTVRWDEKRLEIYTKYGEAVKFVTEGCLYVAGARGYSPWAGRLEHDYTLRDLHAAETARALAFQSVLLLGDASSIRAARAYTASVWEALKYARGEIAGEDGWRRCLDQISATRDDYFAAVRTELQIPPAGATPRVRDQLWPRLANPGAASPDES